MTERPLAGCCVLVVEDDYLIADQFRSELLDAGAVLLGPAGTVEDALDLVRSGPHIDAALLDVGLRGQMVFPVADLLVARGVPFAFVTGYDASVIPRRFQHVVRHEKPVMIQVAHVVGLLVSSRVLVTSQKGPGGDTHPSSSEPIAQDR